VPFHRHRPRARRKAAGFGAERTSGIHVRIPPGSASIGNRPASNRPHRRHPRPHPDRPAPIGNRAGTAPSTASSPAPTPSTRTGGIRVRIPTGPATIGNRTGNGTAPPAADRRRRRRRLRWSSSTHGGAADKRAPPMMGDERAEPTQLKALARGQEPPPDRGTQERFVVVVGLDRGARWVSIGIALGRGGPGGARPEAAPVRGSAEWRLPRSFWIGSGFLVHS
jgi:hypothetical protein